MRGTGIVNMRGAVKCGAEAVRVKWGGVEAEEDGLCGVNLWIEVRKQVRNEFARMRIVSEGALDDGKGMEGMLK